MFWRHLRVWIYHDPIQKLPQRSTKHTTCIYCTQLQIATLKSADARFSDVLVSCRNQHHFIHLKNRSLHFFQLLSDFWIRKTSTTLGHNSMALRSKSLLELGEILQGDFQETNHTGTCIDSSPSWQDFRIFLADLDVHDGKMLSWVFTEFFGVFNGFLAHALGPFSSSHLSSSELLTFRFHGITVLITLGLTREVSRSTTARLCIEEEPRL